MPKMQGLETKSAVPLYKQLKEKIKEQIRNGTFPIGGRIPSEMELMAMFQVSRITVRTAIGELVEENVLIKQRGKGTYVSETPIKGGSNRGARSFFETCRANHKEPSTRLLKVAREPLQSPMAEYLGLKAGEMGIYIEMLRMADGTPIALDYNWYHPRFTYLLSEDLESEIYAIIRKKDGLHMYTDMGYLDIGLATSAEAEMLKVKKGEPLLVLHTNVVDDAGKPVHYGKMLIVGRRYRFYI